MHLTILFDKNAQTTGVHTGWGVAFLINGTVLFDTGEKGSWLLHNMVQLQVSVGQIKTIVISHAHWDHTGGLKDLLARKKGLAVYACPNFSSNLKELVRTSSATLLEVDRFTEIGHGIYTTGEIPARYKGQAMPEQAVAVKTARGISVITGCAHPGIDTIVRTVKDFFSEEKLYMVLGGFHLRDRSDEDIERIIREFKAHGVKKVGPAHCTGTRAEELLRAAFGEDCIAIKVGQEIEL